ncbi:NAD(P)H-dependent oxidoreductase [Priestia endophytica]|uniref:NAD(P)H-dependent oxidoreductase n=1 Tax=Priestia endophytica TaxID=135735 RepID=UPI00203D7083|nr:NAD(P)H-dependent oxidoreductase [Priestia endophytica]MCM3540690.1 NAD(P)H-dependent oxidoreductase [Priestia endophytica]
MSNILIINGHDFYKNRAEGNLSSLICERIKTKLQDKHTIVTTKVLDGYDVNTEIKKFLNADIIIIHTPIYWFSIPGILKKYIDDVYEPGIFFGKSNEFGRGGLLTNKKYMLSVTWGASENEFDSHKESFLEGKAEDDVLFPIHKTHEYCSIQKIDTFSIFEAMSKINVSEQLNRLDLHIKNNIN